MKKRLLIGCIAVCAVFYDLVPAQAKALDLETCMMHVEAMDHAIIESHLPESVTLTLEETLNNAVKACESGAFDQGAQYLEQANVQYDDLIATGPHGLTDADFWASADYMWGHNAHKKNINIMHVKLNDDMDTDMVGWKLYLDSPEGITFDLIGVVKTPQGEVQRAHKSIPYNTEDQISLCSMDDTDISPPQITHTALKSGEGREITRQDVADYMLSINDDMCDVLHVFWPNEVEGEEVQFTIHRN